MKFDIKQFSYLQMNEKFKKNTKSIYWRQKKTKHDYSFTKTFFVTWNMAGRLCSCGSLVICVIVLH